jgi:TPR repeat protein
VQTIAPEDFAMRGRSRLLWSFFAVTVTAVFLCGAAHAQKRIALVIGINDYPRLKSSDHPFDGQLVKAVADAETMGQTLRSLGFDVELGRNLDRTGFLTALDRVKRKIGPGDTVFIFFAGHGVAFKGSNLLLPSDIPPVDPEGEQLIRGLSVAETDMIDAVREKGAGLTILALDACRNNPIEEFAREQARVQGRSFRGTTMRSVGLEARPTSGVFSIYSAGIGQKALDGLSTDRAEPNSVFTRVFIKKLREPGRHLSDVMEDVKEEVARLAASEINPDTGLPHQQFPAFYNETQGGRVYLAGRGTGADARPAVVPPAPPRVGDEIAWSFVNASDAAALGRFIEQFPESPHAAEARARLEEVQKVKAKSRATPEQDSSTKEARLSDPHDSPALDLITECDRLAASPLDPQRPKGVSGVEHDHIDVVPALAACNDAMGKHPEIGRFMFQSGRIAYAQRDYARARELLQSAAAAGSAVAMNNLGTLYEKGEGVPKDAAEARLWFEKAATRGLPIAMSNLGWLYQNGNGVAQDYAAAKGWYERAAGLGNAVAMLNLGWLYGTSKGVAQNYAEARRWYEKAAAAGNSTAMNNLGLFYRDGTGVAQDYTEARRWFERAAAANNPAGMSNLGWLFQSGHGVGVDLAAAKSWYEKAAAQGNSAGMVNLGWLYGNGKGVTLDHAEARRWFEKAAAAGNSAAMNNLGLIYRDGTGVAQSYVEARRWFEEAAAAGNSLSMNSLGWMYQNGFGLSQDYGTARKWYEKASASGNAVAMVNLGWLYGNGKGVPVDHAEARRWYEKAAAAGNSTAMNNLGYFYHDGHGVSQDYAQARGWFEKAALIGNSDSMNGLGGLYQNGHGVVQDYAVARGWYEKAAASGNAIGMVNLGWLYGNGKGVAQNPAEARRWYERAAAAGNARGMNNLGYCYEYGQGVGLDYREAKRWFEKSAGLGDILAMRNLGDLYKDGRGVIRSIEEAKNWYEKAAAAGDATAKERLLHLLR